jgi:hypothetical protein
MSGTGLAIRESGKGKVSESGEESVIRGLKNTE